MQSLDSDKIHETASGQLEAAQYVTFAHSERY